MTLHDLLQNSMSEILADAMQAMARSHARNYEKAGSEHLHTRLKALYVLTMRGVKERNLGPMVAHVESIARERFSSGYDLWEVQTAFNVLEESIWKKILQQLPPQDYAQALGLVSTVLGMGKDTLARRYVTLATKTKVPSLNMQSLFSGTEAAE